jgi:hypothetical protein
MKAIGKRYEEKHHVPFDEGVVETCSSGQGVTALLYD